jgi:hypothetical protein
MGSDLRQKPEDKDLPMLRFSYERHLTNEGCPPERYTEVYELAVKIYRATDFGKGPFNVYHLLESWARIQAKEQHEKKYPVQTSPARLLSERRDKCKTCGGSRIKMESGRIVFKKVGGRLVPEKCLACAEENKNE